MKTIEIKNVVVGQGLPKICVPLTADRKEKLIEQAKAVNTVPCEIIEWRADYLNCYRDIEEMISLSEELRQVTDKPILLTIRTTSEGGNAQLNRRDYYSLVRELVESVDVDAVDIEAFDEEQGFNAEKIEFMVGFSHSCNKKVILSNHDFSNTPDIDVMVKRLFVMQELGADIPKIAVMPKNEQDVLDLLEAARIMKKEYARRPFIALSMGELGLTSRVCGGNFGSAITFASGGGVSGLNASAPGQITAEKLHGFICEYYRDTV